MVRTILRALAVVVILALVVVFAGGLWLRHQLYASLPQVDGTHRIGSRLSSPVLIKRDALGVPTIEGSTRLDVAWATGFVHAQERFFQMDLSRRRAAGELSELFGPVAVAADEEARIHRFRGRARRVVAEASPYERALLEKYADGVNAGLRALGAKPWEYLALRLDPADWKPEDSVLVIASMFFVLEDSRGTNDARVGLMYDALPRPLADFLLAPATEWEAPIVGGPQPKVPTPGADVVDLGASRPAHRSSRTDRQALVTSSPTSDIGLPRRSDEVADEAVRTSDDEIRYIGSNNWAVGGKHTASGAAVVADDMHLGISVPNTWFRASFVWRQDGIYHRVTGATLPGVPVMVVGSNGDIAWGFTNTEGDWSDLVIVEPAPGQAGSYLTPSGPQPLQRFRERIKVKGAADRVVDVDETIWGPIVDTDYRGRPRALRWVPHDPEGLNVRWAGVETATSIEQAFDVANVSGIPAENCVIGDRGGRIGWTVTGRLPRRVGFDGRVPTSWANGGVRWDGWLAPSEYPRVINPPLGRIWTANQRVVGGDMLQPFAYGDYDQGARASQIRDDLLQMEHVTPRDMLKVQLDDRALFLARWRDLALRTLDDRETSKSAERREFLRLLEKSWNGRASVESVGYRLTRAFRGRVASLALDPLVWPMTQTDKRVTSAWARARINDGPLWTLVSTRPMNLLNPRFGSWKTLLLDAIDYTAHTLTQDGRKLDSRTWGEVNTTRIRHPMSAALPRFIAPWLDMPVEQLPGDSNMPRVQSPANGASERMAVSPGREQEGYFHMPGGQSGHPLSPYYRAGYEAWAKGEPTPFMPGRTVHTLYLEPGNSK